MIYKCIWLILFACLTLAVGAPMATVSGASYQTAVSKEHAGGVVSTIMQRVAEKLDINLEMAYAPFARRLVMMETGKIDIMGGLLKRKSRESYIYFIFPPYVASGRKIFFVRKGEAGRIQTYGDLYGLTIGTKIHARYFPRFDRDNNLKKQAVSSVAQNFKKLLLKRVDAVIYSYRSGYTELLELGIVNEVEPAAYYFEGDNPVYIGISKKSPLLAEKDRIERVVREMVDSGEMKTLIKAFYRQVLPRPRDK